MGDEVGVPSDVLVGTENEETYESVVLNPGESEDDRRAALYLADRVADSDPVRAAGIRARWAR